MAFILPTGSQIPEFRLLGSDGLWHTFAGENAVQGVKGTLIVFTCNHCPFVVGSEDRMKALYAKIAPLGIAMVGIHSNETEGHPSDAWPLVLERMQTLGLAWLSLCDDSQLVARAFGAERTPHYFLFDTQGKLVYDGRMDNSPRNASLAETHELEDAIDDLLATKAIRLAHTASIGCNVKWWGKERHWMPGDACDLDFLYTRKSETKTA
jgi:hypothetical protein